MGDDQDTKGTKGITPAEFTKRMPEGEGAGPDAPETLEPRQGREATRDDDGTPAGENRDSR